MTQQALFSVDQTAAPHRDAFFEDQVRKCFAPSETGAAGRVVVDIGVFPKHLVETFGGALWSIPTRSRHAIVTREKGGNVWSARLETPQPVLRPQRRLSIESNSRERFPLKWH